MNLDSKAIDLFVPGRLCLFGEHSDWAGYHKVMNADIVPGQAIVTGIEQGIYAKVTKADKFIVESQIEGQECLDFQCEMDVKKLKQCASQGGYFSYVAGVASYIKEWYMVDGLRICIHRMDLPIKSGLSSSAAICVLVARAFNLLYDLNLSTEGEMNIAYLGEQRTPSRCGRLDQACAYGVHPVNMVFDGNELEVSRLTVGKDLHWVFADLMAGKNTIKILADLNKCFPFPQTTLEQDVFEAFGKDNLRITNRAKELIAAGAAEELGALMTEAQDLFDQKVMPACPSELTSPVLHRTLQDERIKELSYGGKGVGSQGDGSVQFLARDKESQSLLVSYLKEKLGMQAYPLTIKSQRKIRKAVIPVAGYGTRLYPATRSVKKEFLPVIDKDGLLKPVLLVLLEQLLEAGIEEICLIIGEEEKKFYYDYFHKPISEEHYRKLPKSMKVYEKKIQAMGQKVSFVVQKERLGFGHAVYQCRNFTENEPVLLMLGDMIYQSKTEENCSFQLIKAYEMTGLPMVAIHKVPLNEVVHYGIVHGQWENSEKNRLQLDGFVEKPSCEYAELNLGIADDTGHKSYYSVFGQYVLTSDVFKVLGQHIEEEKCSNGEIQLTDALEEVRRQSGMVGIVLQGVSYDVGIPEAYRLTVSEYHVE